MAGNLHANFRATYIRTGGMCVVDMAFCLARHLFFIESGKYSLVMAETTAQVRFQRDATSAHQSAEWGMRALQSSFLRFKDMIIYEERGERCLLLLSLVYKFN